MAGERPPVEDPVCRRVEQRGQPVAEQRPVEEQVDADDRRRLEVGRSHCQQATRLGIGYRRNHRVRIELVERFDARFEPHIAAGGAEGTPGRVAVHLPERLGRQQQIARAAATEERRLDGEDPVVGAGLLGGQVERRPDEDVPEAVDLRLAMSETA